MARKAGFRLNRKTIAKILHNDPGVRRAVDAAAEKVLAKTGDEEAFLTEPYHTDRYVRGVMVPADKQAKNGTGTRAAAQAGLRRGR
ncbi:hypothetical protein [Mycolicibacterium sp. XJ1819]